MVPVGSGRWRKCRRACRACRRWRARARRASSAAHRRRSAAGSARAMASATSWPSPSCLRVVAAHDALQLRELADHGGQQVALAQIARRAARARAIAADRDGDVAGEPAHPARLVAERAELRLEGHGIERRARAPRAAACGPCSQKNAASARRGRTTRSLPARTWSGSRLSMLLTVMKAAAAPRPVLDREIALVVLQRRDQHLARQLQEALLEAAGERHRPFDQRRHLIEQRIAHQRPAVEARRDRRHARRGCARAARRNRRARGRARAASRVGARGARAHSGCGAWKRWPRVCVRPAVSRSVAGTTSRPYSITTQCTGRTNCALPAPQRMRRAMGSASSAACTMPGSSVDGAGTGAGTLEVEERRPWPPRAGELVEL